MLDKEDARREVWVNFEIKQFDPKLIQEIYRLLKQYKRNDRAIWGTMGGKNEQEYLKEIGPEVRRFAT